jgi:hypothetical protein
MAAGPSAIHISFNHNQDALKYLNISQVSQAPVAADDSYSIDEDTAMNMAASGVLANDTNPDGGALTAVLVNAPNHGNLFLKADGSFSYTPNANFCGSDSFTYHANDGTADSNIAMVAIDVVCVNDAPDVTVDHDPVVVNEGLTAVNSGTFSDIDSSNVILSASVGTVTDNGNGTWSWSFDTDDGPADSQVVIITADDGQDTDQVNFTLTVNNVAPSVDSVTVPLDPVDVNYQASFSVDVGFSDPAGTADEPYTCQFDLDYDDTFTVDVTVSNEVGTTNCTTSLNYAEPGVYTVIVNVIDKDGGAGMATAVDFVVIFDPDGGFVTGGGWIASPLGAYSLDPSLIGRANFGFVSKYKKGANVPTGQTEFQFQVADLNFHSSSNDWLVVAGPTAKFKGTGTINGIGNYGFMITATDERLTPSTSLDLFRIKIWDKDNGDLVVYDNQMGEDDNSDAGTEIGGGNIVIHK